MSSLWLLACSFSFLAIFFLALFRTLEVYAGVHCWFLCWSAIWLVVFPFWNSFQTVDSWFDRSPMLLTF